MKLVVRIKLLTTQEQKAALHETMAAYNDACNFVSRYAFKTQVYRNFSLHHALYKKIRAKFNLPSQLAVSVLSKVADSYKTELTKARKEGRNVTLCKFKKNAAIGYDPRILTYGKDNVVSLKALDPKRLKIAAVIHDPTKAPAFQGEADLVYSRKNFYLVQTLHVPNAAPKHHKTFLGVDLGLVKIAVDSTGQEYTNALIETKRIQYAKQRSRLKQAKTASARRHLAKVGSKESNFRRDVNHVISKAIVAKAEHTSQGVVLEKLVQFFDKSRVRKNQRASRSSWSFFQLRTFVSYKAALKGIPVKLVDPAYTSQRCFACGHIDKANRKDQAHFVCLACGHADNADLNASKNLKALADNRQNSYRPMGIEQRPNGTEYRAAINQPIVTSLGLA